MFFRDHTRCSMVSSSLLLGHLDIRTYVSVKILIMHCSDKTGTCNHGTATNLAYSMCHSSEEGCNLFLPLGHVGCWHYGSGHVARTVHSEILFKHLSKGL